MTAVSMAQPVALPVDITAHFCDRMPKDKLCSTIPNDVSDFSASLVYTLIEKNAQSPFDLFSWQSFVALNWPMDEQGSAAAQSIGSMPDAARYWQSYATVDALLQLTSKETCPQDRADHSAMRIREFTQAGGLPLVDQDGNYVVFDARMNQEMARYIIDNGLDSYSGQLAFARSGKQINFPKGHYENPELRLGGSEGAIEIKTAWRMLDPADSTSQKRFFTVNSLVEIDAAHSLTGRAICIGARLALVGMHIVHRTESGNGGDWIWSTFEHVDNAPFADKARGPNSIFAKRLFENDCHASSKSARDYSFFNAECINCKTNRQTRVQPGGWKWADQMPYARTEWKVPIRPTQVSRCWKPSASTQEINNVWQQALTGTVWQNYALSTTQWKGASPGALFPHGEVPRYLTNSTMETFLQDSQQGTCLGCHSAATTAAGQPSNFSFVFLRTPLPE
jgi:hypothetical protein